MVQTLNMDYFQAIHWSEAVLFCTELNELESKTNIRIRS